jgi:hypothetical protein
VRPDWEQNVPTWAFVDTNKERCTLRRLRQENKLLTPRGSRQHSNIARPCLKKKKFKKEERKAQRYEHVLFFLFLSSVLKGPGSKTVPDVHAISTRVLVSHKQ